MPADKKKLPEDMSISLTALEGGGKDVRYQVVSVPAHLGSGKNMDVVLPFLGVEETHARLTLFGGGVYLENLSRGGVTRVNEREINQARIVSGDIIELGEVRLLVQVSSGKSLKSGPDARARRISVWAAGFSSEFREWFMEDVASTLEVDARAFRTGEEVLINLSRALSEGAAPSLLILDLRLPIINGINVAIATRAFELGYRREGHIPILFLFDPPGSASFDKVVKFCQPLKVVPPSGSEENARQEALELTRKVVSAGGGEVQL